MRGWIAAALALVGSARAAAAEPCQRLSECGRACERGDRAACTRVISAAQVLCEAHDDAMSCTVLGRMYAGGVPIPIDLELATAYLKRGCELGDGGACNDYGVNLVNGTGVARDEPAGLAMWGKACDHGIAVSCRNLGGRLMAGRGVARDEQRALVLLKRGCDAGDDESCRLADDLEHRWQRVGTQAVPPPDAVAHLHAAEQECAAGALANCAEVADLVWEGRGVDADPARAIATHDELCTRGYSPSCLVLSSVYLSGEVPRDPPRSRRYLEAACALRDARGCGLLGTSLQADGPSRRRKAQAAFARGCELGDPSSCARLGVLLEAAARTRAQQRTAAAAHRKACELDVTSACVAGARLADAFDADLALDLRSRACALGESSACVAGFVPPVR
ncbi:MAG TPA: hypothetical protein VHE35_19655 [Kofleriaceae bacterium]|nr:hypothetical protein [Kofleriaceae bacterium]